MIALELVSKHAYKTAALCALGVVIAAFFGFFAKKVENDVVTHLLETSREFIYLGMFSVWGFSVYRRVVQKNVKRMMLVVAVLVVFWLVIREYKWRFITNMDASRLMWYLYYVPLLTIPHLSFLISLCLGKSENYRLPKWIYFLWCITGAIILLVLTNDLHSLAFVFPDGVKSESNYTYGAVFYIAALWGIVLALGSLIVMLMRCRVPKSKRLVWLPMIPFAAAVVYIIIFQMNIPVLSLFIGDLAIVDCLLFVLYFECCIQSGLIQSNTRYNDLFSASKTLGMQIFDSAYDLKYASLDAEHISPEIIKKYDDKGIILPGGKLLRKMPIRGGWAVWTEDISELLRVREELEDRQEELGERNALLELEYRREREHRAIEVQNKLYDLMNRKTASQLRAINALTDKYTLVSDPTEKRRILAEISVLGSFIKRRRDIVLTAEASGFAPEAKLVNALAESFHALKKLGISGAYLVDTGKEYIPVALIAEAYDFFEFCVEADLRNLRNLSVMITSVNGHLRCSVVSDGNIDALSLKESFPAAFVDEDECVLPLEGRNNDD